MVIKSNNMNGTYITSSGDGNCMGYNLLLREPNLRVGKIILKDILKNEVCGCVLNPSCLDYYLGGFMNTAVNLQITCKV